MLSKPLEWVLPVFEVDATLHLELILPLELMLPVRRGCRTGASPRFDLSLFFRLLRWELPVEVDCIPVCSLLLLVLVLLLTTAGAGARGEPRLIARRGDDRELVSSPIGTE